MHTYLLILVITVQDIDLLSMMVLWVQIGF